MDEDNYLILVKGKDKTNEISSCDIGDSMIRVTYKSIRKTYTYLPGNVLVLANPVVSEITDGDVVYQNDMPLPNVSRILKFDSKIRVRFNTGNSRVYDASLIRVESNSINSPSIECILDHWRAISRFARVSEDGKPNNDFLKTQYDKLAFVSPSSVLGAYLNKAPIQMDAEIDQDTMFPFKFNLSQKEALDNALRSQISIIEGPPGTGKTQTILNILANLVVIKNKRVAVVSSNNAAVQNVKDKLEAEGYGFLVASLGNRENKRNFFANLPEYDVSGWSDEVDEVTLWARVKEISTQIQAMMSAEREMAQLQSQLGGIKLEQEHFETYYAKQHIQSTGRLSFYRLTSQKILRFLIDTHIFFEQERTSGLLRRLKLIIQHGFTDFSRLKNDGSDVILRFQREYYETKIDELTRKIDAVQARLDKGSFNDLIKLYHEISKRLMRLKLYRKYHGNRFAELTERTYKRDFPAFLERFPIVLSTTHSLRGCVPENFLFDYVIIDESSQVDLLTGALALSCGKRAIIVGDTKQLPQIVNTSIRDELGDVNIETGSPYDYFTHNVLTSTLAVYPDIVPRVMLREHYRCHPRIIEFCNRKYYDRQLIPFTSEQENDRPLLIYRTAPGHHMREVVHGQKGKFNQRELDVTRQEVLVDLKAAQRDPDIGFTTPYRKQVEKAVGQLDDIEIDTIHKYQGREKKVMILSTVLDSSRSGRVGLQFVNDPALINVAVSRAQQQFILVTDHRMFREYGTEIGDLIRYMEYSTLDNNVIDSEIVSVFDLLYREYSEKLRGLRRSMIQRSRYESENIIWALLCEILKAPLYNGLECRDQVFIRNLLVDLDKLEENEQRYVKNGASVDFVIYHKLDNSPVLIIEVDGSAFHENNPEQLKRDRLKDHIFEKYDLPMLRLATTGSGEEDRIRMKLNEVLNHNFETQ